MSTYTSSQRLSPVHRLRELADRLKNIDVLREGALYSAMTIGALLAFEIFNFSTTEFALTDLLGELRFAGLRWSTILALAFCGMDFAGIARLFSPVQDRRDPLGRWYLLGSWLLAATMNALLTWWAVSLALLNHQGLGNEILGRESLLSGVPVFVAVLVWLIRVLMIGSFTLAGRRLFQAERETPARQAAAPNTVSRLKPTRSRSERRPIHPAPKPIPSRDSVPVSMQASSRRQ